MKGGHGWLLGGSDTEITADAWSQRALEPWFIEEDAPSLLSTVSSHSLEREPWGSGAFLKVVSVPRVRTGR